MVQEMIKVTNFTSGKNYTNAFMTYSHGISLNDRFQFDLIEPQI